MRPSLLSVLALLALAGAAEARPEPWTDAPVPNVGPPGPAPSERALGPGLRAADAGPADSTPFSSAPSGTLAHGDQLDQHTRETSPGGLATSPNLAK